MNFRSRNVFLFAIATSGFTAFAASPMVLEGEIIKTKESKNEIYIRTPEGKREEIYLKTPTEIVHGDKKALFSDLEKGKKVRVTDKSKVEILD